MRQITLIVLALLVGCGDDGETQSTVIATGTDVTTDSSGSSDMDGASTPTPDTQNSADTVDEDTHNEPVPCVAGVPCNDKNPCTTNDTCVDAFCKGTEYACDDGRECTADACDGEGGCLLTINEGFCLINNTCLLDGAQNSSNTCQVCNEAENKIGWSKAEKLAPCEDGDPCTFGDYCNAQAKCKKGLKLSCDDGNPCTSDDCEKTVGCTNTPVSGDCDDDDPCTPTSVCSGGVCHALAAQCDDGNPCTVDTCLPSLGCDHQPSSEACEDGNLCTVGDTCVDSQCQSGEAADCDDDSQCTDDMCDPEFGCYSTLVSNPCCVGASHLCNDDNPCTTDSCDQNSKDCIYTNNTAPCSDDDPCTVGDTCKNAVCKSGSANKCDDGNDCTADTCDSAVGCQHQEKAGTSCDDGIECTTQDKCLDGKCVGDTAGCKCDPEFSPAVGKVTSLVLGSSGKPGQGLNVDNKASCSPASNCSDGIDNALAPLHSFLNENLTAEVEKGGVIVLFELMSPKLNGQPFSMAMYAGQKVSKNCKHQTQVCDYQVEEELLNEDCGPAILIDNAKIVNGKLIGGGPGYNFVLYAPLFGSVLLPVTLNNGQITGDIEFDGNKIKSIKNGILAGAMPKSVFSTALEYVPESDLPAPKETLVQLLDILIVDDIDTDGNGSPDAASVGFLFETIGGKIVGVED